MTIVLPMLVLWLTMQGLSLVLGDLLLTPHLSGGGAHSEVQRCGWLIVWEGTTNPLHNESSNSPSIGWQHTSGPSVAGSSQEIQNKQSGRRDQSNAETLQLVFYLWGKCQIIVTENLEHNLCAERGFQIKKIMDYLVISMSYCQ